MRVSSRFGALFEGGSHGWEVYYRAQRLAGEGRRIVNLTVGDHDVPTDPLILDAMDAAARGGALGYAPVAGTDALRRAIADRVARSTGAPCAPEEVAATSGGQFALFAALAAALEPGDGCILIEPCYATYAPTVRAVGGRPVPTAARAEAGFEPDLAAIDAAASAGARALLINSPNNPTGAVYGAATLGALCEIAEARDLWLISDEVYASQVHDARHCSPRAVSGMARRTMTVGSMSKSHAMTGFRLGWLAAPRAVTEAASGLAIATTYGAPGFIQAAALIALEAGSRIEAEIAARYRRRRDAALRALEGAAAVRAAPAAGGMYLFLDIRSAAASGRAFAEALLEERGVAVMPGESFGAAGAGWVRVALTRPEDELAEALAQLAAFASDRAGRV